MSVASRVSGWVSTTCAAVTLLGCGWVPVWRRWGVSGEVRESQLANLLGLGLHPDTGQQLGSRYRIFATVDERIAARLAKMSAPSPADVAAVRAEEERRGERQAVAGFDSTFSPVKSVSVAWALAAPEVAAEIEAAHEAAVVSTLAWIEREAITARTGADGIGHVDVSGLIAAAFTHRTSRAGDPDLHTHLVMSNKVLATLPDGSQRWLTLDSRGLYKANVAFSERYNRVLEDELHTRLGWRFRVRSDQPADAVAPIRELEQVPEPLLVAFSQRRQQIEADYAARVRDYREKHGHEPPKGVQYELAQAACLAQRPEKDTGSTEASERAAWERVAASILTPNERSQLAADLAPATPEVTVERLGEAEIARLAAEVVAELQERRSDWTERHIAASAQRRTATIRCSSPQARDEMIAAITAAAGRLEDVIEVSAPERVRTPAELQRADGTPLWEAPGSRRSSTRTLLNAEARLLDAAREHAPAGLPADVVRLVLGDHDLARDQAAVVRQLAGGDRRVQLLVGPAGTGKTTTMRALVDVWQRAGGRPVRGLAPTAAAASVLRTETGMDQAVTIDYWATLRRTGQPAAQFQAGELVIVDEAGMAGTLNLDRVVQAASRDGAHVVLVGDPRQLAAVASGGGLRLIQNEVGAAQLSTVWRFADVDPATGKRVLREWEAEASLALRDGDAEAVEAYLEHERVRGGSREAMLEDIYTAWLADQAGQVESVMIAPDNATVQALSDRARADRIAAGQVTGPAVTLRNGSRASAGDIIVTRRNDRALRVGGDFVKNGDLWTITALTPDGGLAVTGTHGPCVLPREYVRGDVELGYAMTAHRAQGLTVDHVHTLVDDTLTREVLYVAATRGRRRNQLYTVTEHLLDVDAERPADANQPARAVLRAVLERSDAAISATESIREEDERAASVTTQLERWRYVREHANTDDPLLDETLPPHIAADVRGDDAWPYLREILHWRGNQAAEDLRRAYQSRTLAGAESPARVLAARLEKQHRPTATPGDWLPAGGIDAYSDALLAAARERAAELGVRAAVEIPAWASALGPVPADQDKREQWQHRAGMIAAYREAHDVSSREPLGVAPTDPQGRETWELASTALPASVPVAREESAGEYSALTREDVQSRLVDAERLAARTERRLTAAREAARSAAEAGDGPRNATGRRRRGHVDGHHPADRSGQAGGRRRTSRRRTSCAQHRAARARRGADSEAARTRPVAADPRRGESRTRRRGTARPGARRRGRAGSQRPARVAALGRDARTRHSRPPRCRGTPRASHHRRSARPRSGCTRHPRARPSDRGPPGPTRPPPRRGSTARSRRSPAVDAAGPRCRRAAARHRARSRPRAPLERLHLDLAEVF